MQGNWVQVGEGGRVVIPAAIRKTMGIGIGDELMLRLDDGELRLMQQKQALRKIQAAIAGSKHKAISSADFLKFRREDSGE